ncbi:MAG: PAS domain S-box protein [Sphingobacteriia bacterium]|nr:PAS domain S-box protein [Sphingobacteriia bacterium]
MKSINIKYLTAITYLMVITVFIVLFSVVSKNFIVTVKLNEQSGRYLSYSSGLGTLVENLSYLNSVERGFFTQKKDTYLQLFPSVKEKCMTAADTFVSRSKAIDYQLSATVALTNTIKQRIEYTTAIYNAFIKKNQKHAETLFTEGRGNELMLVIKEQFQKLFYHANSDYKQFNRLENKNAESIEQNLILFGLIGFVLISFSLFITGKENTELKMTIKHNKMMANTINSISETILIADLNRKILYLNPAAEKFFKKKRGEILGLPIEKAIGAIRDNTQVEELFNKVLNDGYISSQGVIKMPDNALRNIYFHLSLIKDDQNKPIGFSARINDLIDLKKQVTLKNQLDLLSENSFDPVITVDTQYNITQWNKAAKEAYGYTLEQVLYKPVEQFVYSDSYNKIRHQVRKELELAGYWQGQIEVYDKDYTIRTELVTINALRDEENNLYGYFGIHKNITSEIRLTNQLKSFNENLKSAIEEKTKELTEKNARLNAIYESNPVYLIELDRNGMIQTLNKSRVADANIKEQFIGKYFADMVNTSRADINTVIQDIFYSRNTAIMHFDFVASDNNRFVAVCYLAPVIQNNEVVSALAALLDVTKEKEKEEEANELKEIIDSSIALVSYTDKNGKVLYRNKAFKKIKPMINGTYSVSPAKKSTGDIGFASFEQALEYVRNHGYWIGENELISENGEVVHILQSIKAHKNKNNEIIKYSTTAIDISELKKKEEQTKKLASIINQSSAYFKITDIHDHIIFINDALKKALEIDGHDNVANSSFSEFYNKTAPTFDDNSMNVKPELIQTGFWQGETYFKSKHGKIIPVLKAQVLHKDKKGNPSYISTTALDLTIQKEKENELVKMNGELLELYNRLQEIREEERNEIARNIHDDLGQYLTMLKFNASWLRDNLKDQDIKTMQTVNSLLLYAQNTIDASRRLMNNLHPNMLENIGLIPTLQWHIQTFSQSTGIDVVLHTQSKQFNFFEKVNLCIYRVLQESLTNILRYAKATKVDVNIAYENNQLNMSIEDNGIGFETSKVDSSHHHGLKSMKEWVFALGGKFNIISAHNQGTIIKIKLPNVLERDNLIS